MNILLYSDFSIILCVTGKKNFGNTLLKIVYNYVLNDGNEQFILI